MSAPKYDKRKAYFQRKPWVRHHDWARRRCSSDDPRHRPFYKDKGVEFRLTPAETEALWHRDGAAKMEKPSLDRVKTGPGKHYEFANCRFIEFNLNCRRAWDTTLDESKAEFR